MIMVGLEWLLLVDEGEGDFDILATVSNFTSCVGPLGLAFSSIFKLPFPATSKSSSLVISEALRMIAQFD